MDIHIWISIYGFPGIPWVGYLGVGYLGGTDGTLGPMGPWDRWDLGLKDPRYFLRVVLSIPGLARPEDHQSSIPPLCTNTITNPLKKRLIRDFSQT